MLMVIFGAGASFDAVKGLDRPDCVPMVADLFNWDERGAYAAVAAEFPACTGLVQELRSKILNDQNVSLENELDQLQELAKDHDDTARQMMALRFYLTELIRSTSERVMRESSGFTSYVQLLRRIGRWQHRTNEEVSLVTFNYDTMLEAAVARQTGRQLKLTDLRSYVHTSPWRVFKLHGSVSWSRFIDRPGNHVYAEPDLAISLGNEVDPADGAIVARPFDGDWGPVQGVVVPAIAVPTISKSGFECPPDHQQVFRQTLPDVNRVLVVGWRGAESHVHDALREFQSREVRLGIVDHGIQGAVDAWTNLGDVFCATPEFFDAPGFAQFADWDQVDGWLQQSAPKVPR